MSYEDITLRELRQLANSAEAGGMGALTVPDLAYLGRQAELVGDAAYAILRKCDQQAHALLNEQGADNIPEGAFGIERTFQNGYTLQVNELAVQIKALDTEAFADLFEFVPEKVERTPAHWEIGSTLKLVNWISKLGTSGKREQLEALLGRTKKAPKIHYRAVDPETGEVLA